MSFGLLFWILMLLWLVGWFWTRPTPVFGWPVLPDLLLFILIGLLGWKVFGAPLHP